VQVVAKDPEKVGAAIHQMIRDFSDQGISVQGVLLVQWIN
jgi:hypothetical protein